MDYVERVGFRRIGHIVRRRTSACTATLALLLNKAFDFLTSISSIACEVQGSFIALQPPFLHAATHEIVTLGILMEFVASCKVSEHSGPVTVADNRTLVNREDDIVGSSWVRCALENFASWQAGRLQKRVPSMHIFPQRVGISRAHLHLHYAKFCTKSPLLVARHACRCLMCTH